MSFLNDINFFRSLPNADLAEFEEAFTIKTIPAGQHLLFEGDRVTAFFVLLKGRIRVYKLTADGDEITMYHVERHESCTLTAYAALSRSAITANAVAESDLQIAVIAAEKFRDWTRNHEIWSEWLFDTMNRRLMDIMGRMEMKKLHPMAEQIRQLLDKYASLGNPIRITHAEIAAELNSNRVVVSRILEEMQRAGDLRLERGRIWLI